MGADTLCKLKCHQYLPTAKSWRLLTLSRVEYRHKNMVLYSDGYQITRQSIEPSKPDWTRSHECTARLLFDRGNAV
jgi:hypothetical protein